MSRSLESSREWTYAEYARFPDDGNRYEVMEGKVLVTPAPSPRHQWVAARLYQILCGYVERHAPGVVLWDVDLLFVTGQFLRPDLVFVPRAGRAGITERGVESVPGLVVEVISPASSELDRHKKPPRYRDFGVPEYWIVDPDARTVEAYRLRQGGQAPETYTGSVRWQPDPSLPPLDVALPETFREF